MLTVQVKYASGAETITEAQEVFVESCNTALVIDNGAVKDDVLLCDGDYAEVRNSNGVVVRTVGE